MVVSKDRHLADWLGEHWVDATVDRSATVLAALSAVASEDLLVAQKVVSSEQKLADLLDVSLVAQSAGELAGLSAVSMVASSAVLRADWLVEQWAESSAVSLVVWTADRMAVKSEPSQAARLVARLVGPRVVASERTRAGLTVAKTEPLKAENLVGLTVGSTAARSVVRSAGYLVESLACPKAALLESQRAAKSVDSKADCWVA